MSKEEEEEALEYRGKYTRTFLGGGTGAVVGGILGGPIGAVVGGAVGGGLGSIADTAEEGSIKKNANPKATEKNNRKS